MKNHTVTALDKTKFNYDDFLKTLCIGADGARWCGNGRVTLSGAALDAIRQDAKRKGISVRRMLTVRLRLGLVRLLLINADSIPMRDGWLLIQQLARECFEAGQQSKCANELGT